MGIITATIHEGVLLWGHQAQSCGGGGVPVVVGGAGTGIDTAEFSEPQFEVDNWIPEFTVGIPLN